MKQEEKQLLLRDLCARLPYGVILYDEHCKKDYKLISLDVNCFINYDIANSINHIKPYLRPMSSMTEEERDEFMRVDCGFNRYVWAHTERITDWLNKYMFDYRGLIPMGLALEAKEDMYKN